MILALPFLTDAFNTNPVFTNEMIVMMVIMVVAASVILLYLLSKRIRRK